MNSSRKSLLDFSWVSSGILVYHGLLQNSFTDCSRDPSRISVGFIKGFLQGFLPGIVSGIIKCVGLDFIEKFIPWFFLIFLLRTSPRFFSNTWFLQMVFSCFLEKLLGGTRIFSDGRGWYWKAYVRRSRRLSKINKFKCNFICELFLRANQVSYQDIIGLIINVVLIGSTSYSRRDVMTRKRSKILNDSAVK